MTSLDLARQVLARVAAYPKQPTRREEVEFEAFCKSSVVALAKARIEEERK